VEKLVRVSTQIYHRAAVPRSSGRLGDAIPGGFRSHGRASGGHPWPAVLDTPSAHGSPKWPK
jgi:hypothetical protein